MPLPVADEPHQTVRAVKAFAGDAPAVLIFTVASVQDFVAAARRTQDLWLGSFLFSYLMWRAIEAVGRTAVLLPSLRDQPLVAKSLHQRVATEDLVVGNIPNIFTALVPEEQAAVIAGNAEAALFDARDDVFARVMGRLEEIVGRATGWDLRADEAWHGAWLRQRTHFLYPNVFWAAVPCRTVDEYGHAAREAGRLLSARKTVRPFFQVSEPGEKCTLCGIRSALHPKGPGEYRDVREFWDAVASIGQEVPDDTSGRMGKLAGRLRKGERLCAVCVTKRLALQLYFTEALAPLDYHLFPSTATIATAPFVRGLLTEAATDTALRAKAVAFATEATSFLGPRHYWSSSLPAITKLVGSAPEFEPIVRLDGQWYYRDAWSPPALRSEIVGSVDVTAVEKVTAKLDELLKAAKAAKAVEPPSSYLTIVALDGDKMGDIISGVSRAGDDGPLTLEYHATLAVALRDFALRRARAIAEEEVPGKLIYAGGDDVLALLPITSTLHALRRLREEFRRALRPVTPTADVSAAAVFVHQNHPLAHAVEEAQHVLKHEAKRTYNRGAVAFRLMKRSGEQLTSGLRWGGIVEGTPVDMIALLEQIVEDLRDHALSPGLAHDLRREGRGVERLPDARVAGLLKYRLRRRRESGTGPALDDARTQAAVERALSLLFALQEMRPQWPLNADAVGPWTHVADLFEIAQFIGSQAGE